MTFITRTRIYGSSWLKRREVKHVRGAMIAIVKIFADTGPDGPIREGTELLAN